MTPLVLGSGSVTRRRMLAGAGYRFRSVPARVDEVLPQTGSAQEVAAALALCKAHEVASRCPDALVVGSDQVLLLPNGLLAGKTWTREEARARIKELSGRTHALISVAALVGPGVEEVVWDRADIRFKKLSSADVEAYLDQDEWLGTAGSYFVESRGIHLMEHVDGDYFTILGMPLLPLVHALTGLGIRP